MIITSSFPRSASDETCGYIREFARSLTDEFCVTLLAPFDQQANDDNAEEFTLIRSKSFLPASLDPLQASSDLNEAVKQGLIIKILLCISLFAFLIRAFKLSFRADVICSHWLLPSGLIGAWVAKALNKPHLVIEHSGALHLLKRMRFGSRLARFISSSSYRIVVVSRNLQENLLALCPQARDKIEVVAMGVQSFDLRSDAQDACPAEVGRPEPGSPQLQVFTLLFIGRLVEIKGLHILLQALAGMPDIRLFIAGEGELRNRFEALAQHLHINATFFGQVNGEEKRRLYAACDAVIIPSLVLPDGRTEGMPVVALEAMTAGKPLIASRVGGLAEIIREKENGLLAEAGNSAALAEKIRLLIADRELQQLLSTNAQQTAASFDWALMGERFGKIIQDALRTHGSVSSYSSARAENRR